MLSVPRIVFMGSPAFAVPSLTRLAERPDVAQVVGCVTQPDKPAGRGRKLTPCAVATVARARGIPLFQPHKVKNTETREQMAAFEADLFVVAAYGRILPEKILALPRLGCVNVHASLLPKYRGASPIAHAIINGDAEAGVCLMQMDAGMDTGDVLACAKIPIDERDTCGSLTIKLAELGAQTLEEHLPALLAGELSAKPQNDTEASYAPLLSKEAGHLDFSETRVVLARKVRGLSPWPGTYAMLEDLRVQIMTVSTSAEPPPKVENGTPGAVVHASPKHGLWIQCGDAPMAIVEVKPAGKKVMKASNWIGGRGIEVGQTLT